MVAILETIASENLHWTVVGAGAAAVLALLGELLHLRRIKRVAALAFGPSRRPASWAYSVPVLRALASGAFVWGMLALLLCAPPKKYKVDVSEDDPRHMVLVLDVSPSMRLEDAGPTGKQSRMHRARDVLDSLFQRVQIGRYRVSVIATYNGAKPVVIDTKDADVVRNVLTDLPMHFAFRAGKTRLFDGLEVAADTCREWKLKSTTVVVVSDGDTVPPTGIPRMPASVSGVLVIGVGDSVKGTFISGRNSRQDRSMLQQIALRLKGAYHDGNKRHIATDLLKSATAGVDASPLERLSMREYALLAIFVGAALLGVLPLLLHQIGTTWRPGPHHAGALRTPRLQTGRPSSGARTLSA